MAGENLLILASAVMSMRLGAINSADFSSIFVAFKQKINKEIILTFLKQDCCCWHIAPANF